MSFEYLRQEKKALTIQEKIDKLDFTKIKNFFLFNDSSKGANHTVEDNICNTCNWQRTISKSIRKIYISKKNTPENIIRNGQNT